MQQPCGRKEMEHGAPSPRPLFIVVLALSLITSVVVHGNTGLVGQEVATYEDFLDAVVKMGDIVDVYRVGEAAANTLVKRNVLNRLAPKRGTALEKLLLHADRQRIRIVVIVGVGQLVKHYGNVCVPSARYSFCYCGAVCGSL